MVKVTILQLLLASLTSLASSSWIPSSMNRLILEDNNATAEVSKELILCTSEAWARRITLICLRLVDY